MRLQPTSAWCNFLGFDPDALLKELATSKGEGETLEWVQTHSKAPRPPWEKILRKLPYFLLPMTQRGLRVIKFPFRVVCMVFKFITFSSRAGGRRRSMRPSS